MKKLSLFFGGLTFIWISLIIFSCNTTGVSPTHYSRLQVINALAGSTPINFAINSTKKSTTSITFPGASGYVSIVPNSGFISFQYNTAPLINLPVADSTNNSLNFKADSSYSIFLTGSTSNYYILKTTDTLTNPSIGKARIRFVNTSTDAGNLDVTINGTIAYTKIPYKGVGRFIEVPAGTYEFKANKTGIANSTLGTLSNQVLADGKIYTLYAAGITTSTLTNAAFGLNLITNLLPAVK